MLGSSPLVLIFVFTFIFVFRSITPLSFLYWIAHLFLPSWPHNLFLQCWSAAEILFFLGVYLPLHQRRQAKTVHPPPDTLAERQRIFTLCRETVEDPQDYLRKFFGHVPISQIKYENLKQFFTWAFLNTDVAGPEYDDELDEYIREFEQAAGLFFEEGRGNAVPLRLTLDPVYAAHRPLAWYSIVALIDITTHGLMLHMGYTYYRRPFSLLPRTFPFRPQTLLGTKQSPSKTIPYWYRPHRSKTKRPILFLHGIGIGLWTYTTFLSELNNRSTRTGEDSDDDVGIIALEILPISFRLTHAILCVRDACREIKAILDKHGFDDVVLVSHSYGTVISTHILKDPSLSRYVNSVVLIDPVSILLHHPNVAYNFVHRKPRSLAEWRLWYFASTDLGVAHTLSRSFFWSENILWKEDLAGRPTTVFLAAKDLIVNTAAVRAYLEGEMKPPPILAPETGEMVERMNGHGDCNGNADAAQGAAKKRRTAARSGNRIEVVWNKDLDHAAIFPDLKARGALVSAVLRHVSTAGTE